MEIYSAQNLWFWLHILRKPIIPKGKYHWESEDPKGLTIELDDYDNRFEIIGKADIDTVLNLPFIKHHNQTIYNLQITNPLPQQVKIGKSTFNTVFVIQILQELLKKQIITKYGKPLARMVNCCFSIPVIAPTEDLGVLVILGKGKAYCLAPRQIED